MPRPRKPTALAVLKGADKANPWRWKKQNRENEPTPNGPLPEEPPEWLNEEQAAAYKEIVARCHKDVLCIADTMIVELGATLVAEMRMNGGELSVAKIGRLMSILDRLGMTPSARSKVQAMNRDEEDKNNPLNEFAA